MKEKKKIKTKYCVTIGDNWNGSVKTHLDEPFNTRKEAVAAIAEEYESWKVGAFTDDNKDFMIMAKEKTGKADGEVHLMLGKVSEYPNSPRIKSRWFTIWVERVVGPFE